MTFNEQHASKMYQYIFTAKNVPTYLLQNFQNQWIIRDTSDTDFPHNLKQIKMKLMKMILLGLSSMYIHEAAPK